MNLIGLVVYPRRDLGSALETLRGWSDERGVEVAQVPAAGQERRVAPAGDPAECDLIVAVGGDGTTLAALRTASAVGKPVLGVACGSLGALFIRYAGDGLIVATALGSIAYTLAAGGPIVAPDAGGFVLTPLAAHGGCCPPLVAGGGSRLAIEIDPGFGGARIELDGQIQDRLDPQAPHRLEVTLRPDHATLVMLGGEASTIAGLRRRRLLTDSPRVLARDDRASAA